MNQLTAALVWLRATSQRILQGEPLRAIVYGAAVTIWLVCAIAGALGIGHLPNVSLDDALTQATAAAAFITEIARRYVWSPASVARVVSGIR